MWFKGALVGAAVMILSIIIFTRVIGWTYSPSGITFDIRALKPLAISFFGGMGIGAALVLAAAICSAYVFWARVLSPIIR